MFENLKKEIQLNGTEISGGAVNHSFGVKLSLMLPEDVDNPSPETIHALYDVGADCIKSVASCYESAVVGQTEVTRKSVENQLENFRKLFREVFCEVEGRNTYSNDRVYLASHPARKILSPLGWTTVYWRKRVIAILFDIRVVSREDIANAMRLLGLQDNTHSVEEAHAYGYAEARKIINAVEICSLARRTDAKYVAIHSDYVHGCGADIQVYDSVDEAIGMWLHRIYDENYGESRWYNMSFDSRPTSREEMLKEFSKRDSDCSLGDPVISVNLKCKGSE